MPAEVRVTALRRYPVKACGAEPMASVQVRRDGLRNDRVFAVVVDDRIVTQRDFPRLALVRPTVDDATGLLTVTYEGTQQAAAVVETVGTERHVALFGRPVSVVDRAGVLSDWFAEVLGAPARLVAAPATMRRATPGAVQGETVLADAGSVSLHSEESLARLNDALAVRGHPALPADRFRANVVIAGCASHAEDDAGRIDVGEVGLAFAQTDERCVVTTVDQQTGVRAGPEPLRTLAGYRRLHGGGVAFGIYAAVVVPGTLRVGDGVLLRPRS